MTHLYDTVKNDEARRTPIVSEEHPNAVANRKAADGCFYPEDLDAWEKKAGVKVGAGDVVFIRTGRWGR